MYIGINFKSSLGSPSSVSSLSVVRHSRFVSEIQSAICIVLFELERIPWADKPGLYHDRLDVERRNLTVSPNTPDWLYNNSTVGRCHA